MAAIAITERQLGIERDRPVAFLILGRTAGSCAQARGIVDAIDQQANGGGRAGQAQGRGNGGAIIQAGDGTTIGVDRAGQRQPAEVLITGLHAVAEHKGAGSRATEVRSGSSSAAIQRDRERWAAPYRNGAIKLHTEIKGLAQGVRAIGRQAHLGDHRSIALISPHVHQHGARRDRDGSNVIAGHHREGPQRIGANAIGIRHRRPVGIDAGIDRVVATNRIGQGRGLAGAKPQGATQQLLHHQAAHRAIGIGNLGLASATTNQIAIADRDRAVLLAANSSNREGAKGWVVVNSREVDRADERIAGGLVRGVGIFISDLPAQRAART